MDDTIPIMLECWSEWTWFFLPQSPFGHGTESRKRGKNLSFLFFKFLPNGLSPILNQRQLTSLLLSSMLGSSDAKVPQFKDFIKPKGSLL